MPPVFRFRIPGLAILFLAGFAGPLIGAESPPAEADVTVVRRIPNGVEVYNGAQTVRVQFESAGTVHVTKCRGHETLTRPSLVVLPHALARCDVAMTQDAENVFLHSPRLTVTLAKHSGAVAYAGATGVPVISEEGASAITPEAVKGETKAYAVETRFKLKPDEGIYGFGSHQDGLMNHRGHRINLVQSNTESAIPFLVSTQGYGLLWDNYSRTVLDDQADACSVWSDVADGIDYYFVYGGSIDGAIAGYRDLTGAAPLYGRWAYGYWQSKEHYANRDEVLKVAAEYRARHIPIDGIVQDWDYWDGNANWNQLSFFPQTYPDPTGMIDLLHQENFHFMISIWCAFGPQTAVYQEMEKKGYLYPTVGWAGFKYFDAYDPAATDLYWQYIRRGLFAHGVDGWWMDSTEPDVVNALTKGGEEYELKRMAPNHLGTFARYLNPYPLLATEAVYQGQRKDTDRKRVYILTRSAFAGQQRAAATTWSGDIGATWDVYRRQITAGVNHSMSGIPYWTFDIGAFVIGSYGGEFVDGGKVPAYQELYTRMFQLGAFSPIFRSHGSETPREIWEFGAFTPVLVKFDQLRYRLLPYIYSQAWRITHEGYSMMRGLPMDFPGDHATYNLTDQFMFGPALLVCPVTDYMLQRPPAPSVLITPDHFRTPDGQPGLVAKYYGDDHFGPEIRTQVEPDINLDWYNGWPEFIKGEKFSMRWDGKLVPPETGAYRFRAKTFGPRLLEIDGQPVKFTYTSVEGVTEPVELQAGREYRFSFATGNAVLGAFRSQLLWKTPSQFVAEQVHEDRPQTRTVYLPAGRSWVDFWTGATLAGGQTVTAAAPIDLIPLYVPAGSLLPLGSPVQYAAENPGAPLELRVYPGADAAFTLYEDENDNYDYEKGVHATIRLEWHDATRQLAIAARDGSYPGMPVRREFQIVVVGPGHGAGPDPTPAADRTVSYAGEAMTVKL